MKALFIHSFLLMTLLTLVGCGSKENAVSLEVTSSFALSAAGYSGGLVVSGKNAIGQRFVKTVFGGTSLKVVLPDGAWDLSVVGWDGVSPYNGVPYCGKSSINLSGTDASATVTINETNCRTADFSGSPFVNTGISQIYPLKIVTCGSFYRHSSESSFIKLTPSNQSSYSSSFCEVADHPMDLRSRTKSIKLIPIDKNFNGVYSGQPGNNPVCVSEMAAHNGIFNLTQQIPVAGLPIQIAFYEDSACQKQSSFVLFPDGLKNGYPAKFDSIFGDIATDGLAPAAANRLIVSDNGINRGWSPFYALMPNMKCSSGFCGDFVPLTGSSKYSDATFDFFMNVDYEGTTNEAQPLTFPASSDICAAVIASHPSTVESSITNSLDISECSYNNGEITLMVKPQTGGTCSSELDNICHSPTQKFILLVNGEYKEIYFSGKKDYAGTVQPVPFSHLFVNVKNYTTSTTCGNSGTDWLPFAGGTNNVLAPEYLCVDPAATLPILLAKPFYNTSNKSFQVEDSGTNYGKIEFNDGSTQYLNLLMLPPDAQEQRNLTNLIFETIGGTGWLESFKYENNNDSDDDESRAYGSIRRAREIFSPDGPGGLFSDTDVCSSTVGTKQIRLTHKDQPHDIEITIANINGNTSVDSRHVRPTAYCNDTNLTPGSCGVAAPENYGKFEKAMLIKEDGVAKEVVLFDCGSKRGRYESVHSDVRDGKYQRGKELMYWNTQNTAYARFERYSRHMESTVSNFASTTRSERSFEKVFKYNGDQDKIHGRVYKYSTETNPSTSAVSQNLTAARFQLNKSSTWVYSYAFFDFHVPSATDLFPSTGEYSTLKTDAFTNTHFCGMGFKFPQDFVYNKDCSTSNFISGEVAPLFGTFTSYQHIKGTNFDPIMNSGYFPVSWP